MAPIDRHATSVAAAAFRTSLPVMFGYVPLGMAFGVLFQDLGYAWYYAPLMGIFVYAGAAQFMAVGLLSAQAGLLEVGISTLLLNSRHIFFGLSMLQRYPLRGLRRLYLIFGLTDETYSLITGTPAPQRENEHSYYFLLTAMNQSYWVAGCAVGALLGSLVTFDSSGMDFALTALFMVLVLEQWKKLRRPLPFAVAAVCALVALSLYEEQMLLLAIALSLAVLLLQWRYQGES
ncbi:MAG: AzlC family ABC transporter permease [Sedimenticola sp.]